MCQFFFLKRPRLAELELITSGVGGQCQHACAEANIPKTRSVFFTAVALPPNA